MKVEVDKDLCIGAGTCAVLADKTFKINDEGKAEVIDQKGNTDEEIMDAAKSCPVLAIKVYDDEGKLIHPV